MADESELHNHVCGRCGAILGCEGDWCEWRELPPCPRPSCGVAEWRREDGAL